jgi:hypothetical protein
MAREMATAREMEMIRSVNRQCSLQKREKKYAPNCCILPIHEDIAY